MSEIFHSLQGETSHSGLPYAFIRLSGCNLRCTYCDSAYAFKGGETLSIEKVLARIEPFQVKHVLVTGGEPLLQRNTPALVQALKKAGYEVSIETHGEASIEPVAGQARLVMDIKTPGSAMNRGGFEKNLRHLRSHDEIKFVITSEPDYDWAKQLVRSGKLPPCEVLFSPAVPAKDQPGTFKGVNPRWLAEQILADHLPVRFQLQLHKALWGADQRGI